MYVPCTLVTNNHTSFHLWWKENLVKQSKFSKYYGHGCLQNFLLLFMPLLTAPIVKNSHILTEVYFIFLKKRPGANLKAFSYRIWTSVKRSEKELSSKTKFGTFWQISCPNFRLKQRQRPHNYWNCQKIKFEGGWCELETKRIF